MARPKKPIVLAEGNPLAGVTIGMQAESTNSAVVVPPEEERDIWTALTIRYECRCMTIRFVPTESLTIADRLADHKVRYEWVKCPIHIKYDDKVAQKRRIRRLSAEQIIDELLPTGL